MNPGISRTMICGFTRKAQIPPCVITVMRHDAPMRSKKAPRKVTAIPSGTRITVTFPPNDYNELVRRAAAKRVSASWVVRDAVEKYLAGDIPLLANTNGRHV